MKSLLFVKTCLLIIINANAQNYLSEQKIKSFIITTPNTYRWYTNANDISLHFIKDGRLHIQGSDGEATMWEGKWSLKGNKLTMKRPDLEKTLTVAVRIDGEFLWLDGVKYRR
jgi:hypothetical protein